MEQAAAATRYMISECADLNSHLCIVGPAPDLVLTPIKGAKLWDLGDEGASFMCPWDRCCWQFRRASTWSWS
jgi:hypothetical protein